MNPMFHISERASGLTNYYFADKLAQLRRLQSSGVDIINLGVGSPDLPASPLVLDAIQSDAAEPGSFAYQAYRGIPELREALALYFQRDYGIEIEADGIVPLLGSKEGCGFIALAHLDAGDGALVPNPGYPTYSSATRLAGGIPVPFALTEAERYHPRVDVLEALFSTRADSGCTIRMMWLNYPNMPTGAAPDPSRLRDVLHWASERKVLVVHDNPYARILSKAAPFSLLALSSEPEGVIELHSMSKSHRMAGARMGFALGTPRAVAPLFRIATQFGSGMWRSMQRAAAAALLEDGKALEASNAIYAERQREGVALLESLGCRVRPGQTGLFIWAEVPEGWDGDRLSDAVLHATGVFLTPGKVFGSEGNQFLRLSLCSPVDVIRSASQRLDNFELKQKE